MASESESGPGPTPRSRRWHDDLTVLGDELVGRVKEVVQEGNVRRVSVKHDGRTLLEVPLTIGVVGALLAPQVTALGAMAALLARCTLTVEREEPAGGDAPEPAATDPSPPVALPPGGTPSS